MLRGTFRALDALGGTDGGGRRVLALRARLGSAKERDQTLGKLYRTNDSDGRRLRPLQISNGPTGRPIRTMQVEARKFWLILPAGHAPQMDELAVLRPRRHTVTCLALDNEGLAYGAAVPGLQSRQVEVP